MSLGFCGASEDTPRLAAFFIARMMSRHTTTHPIETTISRTHAIVKVGSVRNSRNGR